MEREETMPVIDDHDRNYSHDDSDQQQQLLLLQFYNNHHHRALQGNETATTTMGGDAKVLRDTFVVYGSFLLGAFFLFCYVRRRFPRPYQLRNWVTSIQSELAQHQFGFVSWMWELNSFTDNDLLQDCGMDAVSVLRILRMGYKIACIGIFNAIFLLPVYATSHPDVRITDPVTKLTIGNIAEGSPRLAATVLAAYVLFGYTMYMIYREFEWFTNMRHMNMARPVAQNYAVYVRNVPIEYRTDKKLKHYFESCLSEPNAVTEVRLKVRDKSLQAAYEQRETILRKLTRAFNVRDVLGKTPRHRQNAVLGCCGGKKVESIPTYARELKASNQLVTKLMREIRDRTNDADSTDIMPVTDETQSHTFENKDEQQSRQHVSLLKGSYNSQHGLHYDPSINGSEFATEDVTENTSTLASSQQLSQPPTSETNHSSSTSVSTANLLGQGVHLLKNTTNAVAQNAVSKTQMVVGAATDLMPSMRDGDYYPSGFVCFRSLRATHSALQMVHHAHPFYIAVTEAPRPSDIFWANVGRKHQDLQLGELFSLAATATLCFLWTIPMSFVASLSSVKGLSEKVPFIRHIIEVAPFVGSVLEVLAPLFVKVVNGLLPTLLGIFSMLEGPVSESEVAASTFTKLATFMIVQTFFVSAVSSSILAEIGVILDEPKKMVQILAVSLPTKSVYFIQIVFVATAVSCSLEILRVMPLLFASIRSLLPPKLTEQERQTTLFGFIRPLADPSEFEHGDYVSQIVLMYIVMLVYAVIAPLTVFILAFCFIFTLICYKHQFIYIYPPNPDSGGKIWLNFTRILMTSMLIGEFTIVGLMSLKKGLIAAPLMIPLIIITVLFNVYIRKQHFRVAEYLPSRECMKVDVRNEPDFDATTFTKDAYLQEELRNEEKLPEDLTDEQLEEILNIMNESNTMSEYSRLNEQL